MMYQKIIVSIDQRNRNLKTEQHVFTSSIEVSAEFDEVALNGIMESIAAFVKSNGFR